MYVDSARQIWKQLESRYSLTNGSRKYQLNKSLYETKQRGQSVNEYYSIMKAMWDELDSLNVLPAITKLNPEINAFVGAINQQKEELKLFQFLNGLDEDYSYLRTHLLMYTVLPIVETACGASGNVGSDTEEEIDHGFEGLVKNNRSYAGMVSCFMTKMGTKSWIIDSGASDHMIASPSDLNSCVAAPNKPKINLPNGNTAAVTHIGIVELENGVTLKGVLRVPEFRHNLLSLSKLVQENGCCVLFYSDHCVVKDVTSHKIVAVGRPYGGLYYLEKKQHNQRDKHQNKPEVYTSTTSGNDTTLWHNRLGHAPLEKLKQIGCIKGDNGDHKELQAGSGTDDS
ncbi:Retrovirus-related Pol polyprotein from transposon RE1 [Bienertia sinuspersici]